MGATPADCRRRHPAMTYGWLGSALPLLWPGLPQLWYAGLGSGLAVAVGFGLLLQALIVRAWLWPEWWEAVPIGVVAAAVAVAWAAGIRWNRRWLKRCQAETDDAPAGDLFPTAFAEYLQGNWFVAEENCRRLIQFRRHDVEARLLLATLLRRTNRRTEAAHELDALSKFDGATRWQWEIADERNRLQQAETPAAADGLSENDAESEVSEPTRRAA